MESDGDGPVAPGGLWVRAMGGAHDGGQYLRPSGQTATKPQHNCNDFGHTRSARHAPMRPGQTADQTAGSGGGIGIDDGIAHGIPCDLGLEEPVESLGHHVVFAFGPCVGEAARR